MATALESASLVMIPSGYEEGTLGSLQPLDGSGDFNFSRGSNLSATRVNQDGYIEKGYENLLRQSNQFDTTWTTSNASVTGGQAGYDGSNDAWVLEKTNSSGSISQAVSANNLITFSVYAKAATNSWLRFNIVGWANVFINLSNGDIGRIQGTAGITATAINAGGGWYRCSFTYNAATTSQVSIIVADSDGSTSSPTGSIYIQDAQLNQGLVAYPYLETTTTSAKGGILENTPRIDYTGGGAGSLLLEPSRNNVLGQTEYFDGYYTKFASGISYDTNTSETLSPEGLYNATKLISSTNNEQQAIYKGYVISTPTLTCYAKAGEFDTFALKLVGSVSCNFTLTGNGSIGYNTNTSNKSIEPVGNGWYRCSISATTDSVYAWIAIAGGNTQGDGTSGIYIYGAQLEQGSYPTSYIPTYGTSQTRAVDVCGDAGDVNTFNSTEGVLYVEASKLTNGGSSQSIAITDGTNDNVLIIQWNLTLNRMQFYARSGGGTYDILVINGITQDNMNKIALSWDAVNYYVWVNGVKLGTKAITSSPIGLNKFGFSQNNSTEFYGNTKQVLVFKQALSDEALIELTTI